MFWVQVIYSEYVCVAGFFTFLCMFALSLSVVS